MSKLALSDTAEQILVKMSEGNPGALTVLMGLMKENFHSTSGAMIVMWLDEWEIYGESIWILYKDKCHEDWKLVERAFRAVQLGYIPLSELKDHRFDAAKHTLPVEEMFDEMKRRTRR